MDPGTHSTLVWGFLKAVMSRRDDFVADDHCRGENIDQNPSQVVSKIIDLSGIDLTDQFYTDEVTRDLNWHTTFCRQNGVHVTPSFAVDDIIDDRFGSGQRVVEWCDLLTEYQ